MKLIEKSLPFPLLCGAMMVAITMHSGRVRAQQACPPDKMTLRPSTFCLTQTQR